jgi:hypothetical protein
MVVHQLLLLQVCYFLKQWVQTQPPGLRTEPSLEFLCFDGLCDYLSTHLHL